jgi:putative glutathione S-transferase
VSDQPKGQYPSETSADGCFVRQKSVFRNRVTADGSSDFPAEAGRYDLYVSLACPWAHRTIIFRKLKRLEDAISMSVVDPLRSERGWSFTDQSGPDAANNFRYLSEAYIATDAEFADRVTVPVLWDRKTGRIVNNESSEIIRMFNSEFDAFGDASIDFYPEELREEIDAINQWIYRDVNNGVYRAGFATTQAAHEEGVGPLFDALDDIERRLVSNRYLVGNRLTESDWRLFTTLVRFDAVYVGHFKCNRRRISDYPALGAYLRDLYQHAGVAETVDMDQIKRHYYVTHENLNPTRVVPVGPDLNFDAPHGREGLTVL